MRPWSCDTFVVSAEASESGRAMLGKNSDRPVYDSQPLRFHPARPATPARRLDLAYVELPDAGATHAHLGGSPYWCWGHEFGLNACGVAIGNEALFTRDLAAAVEASHRGAPPEPGLLGMELVRLGLERAASAAEAVEVIGDLVSRYGQWGSGVPATPIADGAYDASFLVADPNEAWVLETSGRRWVARRVTDATWSISNQPTIRRDGDTASPDLAAHAIANGWWPETASEPFDFARAYADPRTPLQVSHIRLCRSRELLTAAARTPAGDGIGLTDAMRVLRDHYEDTFLGGPYFSAALPDFHSLCMHAHPSGFTWGNTAASVVCVLPREGAGLPQESAGLPHLWWTPLTPCTGVYLPVFVHAAEVPEPFTRAGASAAAGAPHAVAPDTSDGPAGSSYWWKFHDLLERTKGGELAWHFEANRALVRQAFDPLEVSWRAELPDVEAEAAARLDTTGPEMLAAYTRRCADQALAALDTVTHELATD